jgi:hypothetical protein
MGQVYAKAGCRGSPIKGLAGITDGAGKHLVHNTLRTTWTTDAARQAARQVACLVELLVLLGAVRNGSADDLLRKDAAHDFLHGGVLLVVPQVLIHQVLHASTIVAEECHEIWI